MINYSVIQVETIITGKRMLTLITHSLTLILHLAIINHICLQEAMKV